METILSESPAMFIRAQGGQGGSDLNVPNLAVTEVVSAVAWRRRVGRPPREMAEFIHRELRRHVDVEQFFAGAASPGHAS